VEGDPHGHGGLRVHGRSISLLLYRLRLCGYLQPLELAFAIWMIAALPATVTNFIFIKLHPAVLVSHSLGWLVRLMVFAASYSLIIDR